VAVRAPQFDSLNVRQTEQLLTSIPPATQEVLDAIGGYIAAFDENNVLVYRSAEVASLSGPSVDSLNAAFAQVLRTGGRTWARTRVGAGDGRALVVVLRTDPDPPYRRYRVFAGVEARPTRAALELLGSVVLALPLVIAVSVLAAYRISRAVVEPLEALTSEVVAISDGRSLHRRLPVLTEKDELGRLATQLNSMIERLETSFGALRRFTADASHELKTPLTVLRADVERAMHAPPHSTEQLVALEEALQETTRMANLVESLLTLARADEGRFDLHREPVELEPLVRDVFETALILGEEAGLTVTLPVVEHATVLGDQTRLRQLFLNLVTNAIKYTPRGGDIELSLVCSDHEATFSVRDTGIGISAADLPHVFDRFFRSDRARSRLDERGGFGLGLSISQWIAQAHGGSLTAQSRLHRGSTFTVTLPTITGVDRSSRPAPDRVATTAASP
jgi:signal transduction histidine kinase